ncbi:Beta-lactamase-like domain protein [Candidatus Magnetobacterium bavaricum]|uniref:Beta-lactamase-like domain protein n=1 Tax=Candidatus Magnetobacterium bavaricum TaxID=29290 RepID=A0A0F3GSI2_9BACT|nr:Beta-lactamase-like domain protein [Candidatus Magnetobacterium bavaricum]
MDIDELKKRNNYSEPVDKLSELLLKKDVLESIKTKILENKKSVLLNSMPKTGKSSIIRCLGESFADNKYMWNIIDLKDAGDLDNLINKLVLSLSSKLKKSLSRDDSDDHSLILINEELVKNDNYIVTVFDHFDEILRLSNEKQNNIYSRLRAITSTDRPKHPNLLFIFCINARYQTHRQIGYDPSKLIDTLLPPVSLTIKKNEWDINAQRNMLRTHLLEGLTVADPLVNRIIDYCGPNMYLAKLFISNLLSSDSVQSKQEITETDIDKVYSDLVGCNASFPIDTKIIHKDDEQDLRDWLASSKHGVSSLIARRLLWELPGNKIDFVSPLIKEWCINTPYKEKLQEIKEDISKTIKNEQYTDLQQIADAAYKNKDTLAEPYFKQTKKVHLQANHITLIPARRWNSSTPVYPPTDYVFEGKSNINDYIGKKIGGGYFLVAHGLGIVIDPGYNFLEILYLSHEYTVKDIDVIIITHDHPDHHADLPNILAMKFESYQRMPKDRRDKLRLFLNESCNRLYLTMLNYYRDVVDIEHIITCNDKTPISLLKKNNDYLTFIPIKAYHKEIFDYLKEKDGYESMALGLVFSIKLKSDNDFKIAITGDTSFPDIDNDHAYNVMDFVKSFEGSDILICHLGSIEYDFTRPEQTIDIGDVRYQGGHLGINGCARLVNMLDKKPTVVLITEFGQELDSNIRTQVTQLIGKLIDNENNIFPTDINTRIEIDDNRDIKLFCSKWVDKKKKCNDKKLACDKSGYLEIGNIDYKNKDGFINYLPSAQCPGKK